MGFTLSNIARSLRLFTLTGKGTVEVHFNNIRGVVDEASVRRDLLDALNAIADVKLPQDAVAKSFPSFSLSALAPPSARAAFLSAMDSVARSYG